MGDNRESSGNAPKSPTTIGPVAFGDVRFDAHTGELQRNDIVAKLTLKAAALLAVLLERAPALVTKEELLARVWDGKAVGDEALTSCIQEVRRALGDDARQPRYIETRHRRGYRLIVPAISSATLAPTDSLSPPCRTSHRSLSCPFRTGAAMQSRSISLTASRKTSSPSCHASARSS